MGIINEIARRTGMSAYSVCKFSSDPFGFSDKTAATVRRLYKELGGGSEDGRMSVGICIPNRPVYFWREAVRGINAAHRELKERGTELKLEFRYGEGSRDALEELPVCDAYIIYPAVLGPEETQAAAMPDAPTVMLNDMIPEKISDTAVYVGADGYQEGRLAAGIAAPYLKTMKAVAAVSPGRAGPSVEKRIEGFTREIERLAPWVKVTPVKQELSGSLAASFLAKKLSGDPPDCIYVATGKTCVAGLAISKLEAKKHIVCLGHERSDADRRYLASGCEIGYVAQDAFAQGRAAFEQIARCLAGGEMKSVIIPSEAFTTADALKAEDAEAASKNGPEER